MVEGDSTKFNERINEAQSFKTTFYEYSEVLVLGVSIDKHTIPLDISNYDSFQVYWSS